MVKIIVGDSDRMATNKAMIREGTHMRMPKVNLKAVAHEQDHKPAPRLHNNAVISGNGLAGGSLAGGSMVHHPSNLERLIMASKQKSMSNLDFHKKARGK